MTCTVYLLPVPDICSGRVHMSMKVIRMMTWKDHLSTWLVASCNVAQSYHTTCTMLPRYNTRVEMTLAIYLLLLPCVCSEVDHMSKRPQWMMMWHQHMSTYVLQCAMWHNPIYQSDKAQCVPTSTCYYLPMCHTYMCNLYVILVSLKSDLTCHANMARLYD